MTKAAQLRELLRSDRLIRVAGAHNGMSAKLVEEARFEAIWASGLEISAARGLPDTSIMTMTEFLEVAAQMDFVTAIPIIADCNTGYGDEYNVRHLVRHYERQHIAAVCIEDKVFPKINSFMNGAQTLESAEKFASKIRAAKFAQKSPDFVIIARTEAFIAGLGWEVALARSQIYAEAGADIILVHSKAGTADEIAQFMKHWTFPVPIAVVPTTYPSTTTQELQDLGVKVVIYANQGIRSSVKAMRTTFSRIVQGGHASGFEDQMISVQELFTLQGIES
ncbi:MAG: isocitrate lyase/phosphoenolpyruvate mutase family protein [Ktedonobacteraceae bacterium]|nr:isocitrate lyase/phosphoenolpyruvate mutase family protein [Ktedonobacteraceae bacterium]